MLKRIATIIQNTSMSNKVRLPLLLILALVLVLSGASYLSLTHLSKQTHYQNNVVTKAMRYLLDAEKDLFQAKVSELAIIATLENRDSLNLSGDYLKSIYAKRKEDQEEAFTRVQNAEDILSKRTENFSQNFSRFKEEYIKWKNCSDEAMLKASEKQFRQALEISIYESQVYFKNARKAIAVVTDALIVENDQETTQIETLADNTTYLLIVIVTSVITFIALLCATLPKMVADPACRLRDSLEELASGEGDLSKRLDISGHDELGQVARSYNLLMDKLQLTIIQIQKSGQTLKKRAMSLSKASQDNISLSENQRDTLTMILTAVDEMSATINEIAKNAELTADTTGNIAMQVNEGTEIVEKSATKATDLASQMKNTVTAVAALEEEAAKISSVMDVIRTIAEQTNLLALNAAIEAARAGEQGRGFAVVADEVRSLAGRTQHSTEDIRQMIENLENGVKTAVKIIEQSNIHVESTVDNVQLAHRTFLTIKNAINSVSDKTTQIAAATEEQSCVIEDICNNLNTIDEQSRVSFDNSLIVSQEASRVNSGSAELKEVVDQFKL